MTAAPSAVISNGLVRAVVQLPDPTNGFYRATRFDWNGVISSLTAVGHEFFGPWRDLHDPLLHDCITGLAEEFQAFPDPDIDYTHAEPGGAFLRLGVGLLRKPPAKVGETPEPFERFRTYHLIDPGQWSVRTDVASLRIEHRAHSPTGLAYRYAKTIRLLDSEPVLLLEHTLENLGDRTIHTHHYNHNFFRIDRQHPAGDCVLQLPFAPRFLGKTPDLLHIETSSNSACAYNLSLARALADGESILTELHGFENIPNAYNFALHHRGANVTVSISSDSPLSRLLFWATHRTFCPEPYIPLNVPPGACMEWTLRYHFSADRPFLSHVSAPERSRTA